VDLTAGLNVCVRTTVKLYARLRLWIRAPHKGFDEILWSHGNILAKAAVAAVTIQGLVLVRVQAKVQALV
jgi:hypothetical protein